MSRLRTYVVTVNYNGADDTASCLASLEQSTVPVRAVLVDNTPNDPELQSTLVPFGSVHLINAAENLGFGMGNNLGIDWALQQDDCEFVLILNNDAAVQPDAIELMQVAMDTHPDTAVVTSRIVLSEDPSRLWYGGGEVDWRRGSAVAPGMGGGADAALAMTSRHVTFASGCSMLVRAEVFKRLGGFDHRFFMYEEDLELSLRIQEHHWRIWYESSAVVLHKGQGSQRETEEFIPRYSHKNPKLPFFAYHGIKNTLLNMYMHAHKKDRVAFIVFFPLLLARRFVLWGVSGRFDAIRAGIKAIFDYRRVR